MKKKKIFRGIVFLIIFFILFGVVTETLEYKQVSSYRGYKGFYQEPKDSLDAVYIGSSNCYAFWNSMAAWKEFGINVYPFAAAATSFYSTEYLIREARKTQPDAVFIVNINTMEKGTIAEKGVRYTLDSMPLSWNKLALAHHFCEVNDEPFAERLKYYFSIITYHSRWDKLEKDEFNLGASTFKGTNAGESILSFTRDLHDNYIYSEERGEVPDALMEATDSLLDYCDRENVKVLFVTVPQARGIRDVDRFKMYNSVNDHIESRGYPTLNLMDQIDALHIDTTKDFYNGHHTNIHGSLKFTYYLSDYLIEHYGFKDKREDASYQSWDESFERYRKKIGPFVPEHELIPDVFDPDLKKTDVKLSCNQNHIKVTWDAVDGADGYLVYRKTGKNGQLEKVAETTKKTWSERVQKAGTYYYMVVPYADRETRYYGDYQYNGDSIRFK